MAPALNFALQGIDASVLAFLRAHLLQQLHGAGEAKESIEPKRNEYSQLAAEAEALPAPASAAPGAGALASSDGADVAAASRAEHARRSSRASIALNDVYRTKSQFKAFSDAAAAGAGAGMPTNSPLPSARTRSAHAQTSSPRLDSPRRACRSPAGTPSRSFFHLPGAGTASPAEPAHSHFSPRVDALQPFSSATLATADEDAVTKRMAELRALIQQKVVSAEAYSTQPAAPAAAAAPPSRDKRATVEAVMVQAPRGAAAPRLSDPCAEGDGVLHLAASRAVTAPPASLLHLFKPSSGISLQKHSALGGCFSPKSAAKGADDIVPPAGGIALQAFAVAGAQPHTKHLPRFFEVGASSCEDNPNVSATQRIRAGCSAALTLNSAMLALSCVTINYVP